MRPFIDGVFSMIFPVGFLTIYINIYIFMTMLAFCIIQKVLCNDETSQKEFSLNLGWKSFLFFLLSGFFYPILMIIYASLIFLIGFFDIAQSIKNSTPFKKYLKIILLIIFSLAYIAQYGLWGLLFFRYSKTQALVFLVGLTIGILFFIEQKIKKMNLLIKIQEIIPRITKQLKIVAVILPIISASIFFPILFIRPHDIPDSNASGTFSLRIMSYNIRNAGSSERNPADAWPMRKEFIADYIETFDLDIFGVQEAYLKQLKYIQKKTENREYDYIGIGRDDGTFGGEIEAIFYDTAKFEYIDSDTFWLSDTPMIPSRNWDKNNYRSCTWVRFEDRNTNIQFFVFNTHYSAKQCEAVPCVHEKASVLINEKISELTGDFPTILMGDFNMQNTSLAFSYLEEYGDKHMHDSFKEFHNGTVPFDYTTNEFQPFSPELDKKKIDYIFLSSSIVADFVEIPKDIYGDDQTYSDHYPVLATITINA
ncbi:endonuclease/exonuclease/phosphatase family protein [Promethearchaeum syntrophicum]|uniref:Endonuclease/exonuclease/phosphatase family protein n=1 Tax=Promethearchaeum syntrophicum TaxID=2594042 RepID=A0A5B9DEP2_9ARCH|nr:endonuclease/exonuclease/phosphatase family protein [Candidatus Prometheoarchaeum syntrophicum]QEE17471.1 Endonuclease/Exonuclease/phosphatase family protein [Candidatus Prometheoarchaeum syntrophicum]